MSDFVSKLKAFDENLRVLAVLGPKDWEFEYIRDDLQDEYDESVFEGAYRSMMANQVSSDDFGSISGLGDVIGQQYYFDEVVVFQFPFSRYESLFVSYDRTENLSISEVVEIAENSSEIG